VNKTELQPLLQREPFRPFGIRLTNGEEYQFLESRDLGAPRKVNHTIFYFGGEHAVLIDVDHITEIFHL
jgi:hypothetical protein